MSKNQWRIGRFAPFSETEPMNDWPDGWWNDYEWCCNEIQQHPCCVLSQEIGRTCKDIDPEGPGSCHCRHCNLIEAIRKMECNT